MPGYGRTARLKTMFWEALLGTYGTIAPFLHLGSTPGAQSLIEALLPPQPPPPHPTKASTLKPRLRKAQRVAEGLVVGRGCPQRPEVGAALCGDSCAANEARMKGRAYNTFAPPKNLQVPNHQTEPCAFVTLEAHNTWNSVQSDDAAKFWRSTLCST